MHRHSSTQAKQVVSSFRDSVYSQWKWLPAKDVVIQKLPRVSRLHGTCLSFQGLRRLRLEDIKFKDCLCATK